MNFRSYNTKSVRKEDADKKWFVVNADKQVLGRLASRVALIIRGKHKPSFTPHVDTGDYVIVINAEKVVLTGKNWAEKEYTRHTGYPGGQRKVFAKDLLAKKPIDLVKKAVKGMLPKTKLGHALQANIFVYAGTEHPHQAQQPQPIELNTIR